MQWCPLVLTDGEEEHISAAVKMMSAVAQKYTDEFKATKNTDNEMPELKFLYEGPEVFIYLFWINFVY